MVKFEQTSCSDMAGIVRPMVTAYTFRRRSVTGIFEWKSIIKVAVVPLCRLQGATSHPDSSTLVIDPL